MISWKLARSWSRNGIGIWIMDTLPDGRTRVAKPATIELGEPDQAFFLGEPTLFLRGEECFQIMNELMNQMIEMGIRPNTDRAAGELESSKKHLTDLKEISSRLLGIFEKQQGGT